MLKTWSKHIPPNPSNTFWTCAKNLTLTSQQFKVCFRGAVGFCRNISKLMLSWFVLWTNDLAAFWPQIRILHVKLYTTYRKGLAVKNLKNMMNMQWNSSLICCSFVWIEQLSTFQRCQGPRGLEKLRGPVRFISTILHIFRYSWYRVIIKNKIASCPNACVSLIVASGRVWFKDLALLDLDIRYPRISALGSNSQVWNPESKSTNGKEDVVRVCFENVDR